MESWAKGVKEESWWEVRKKIREGDDFFARIVHGTYTHTFSRGRFVTTAGKGGGA